MIAAKTKWSPRTRLALAAALLLAPPAGARAQQAPPAAAPAAPAPALAPEARPVADLVAAFAKAYNAQDAVALAGVFAADAELIDAEGGATAGAQPIAEAFAALVQESGVQIAPAVEAVKFLAPNVAQFRGTSTLTYGPSGPPSQSKFRGLAVGSQAGWKIAELRDEPVPAPAPESNYDNLKELEWMVGDWVDESADAKVGSSIKWALNRNYLVREYSVEIKDEAPMSGVMWLGFDPQSQQIKSWVFDSNGGHGTAIWTRSGDNQWVLKAQGVTRDGRPSSATQIITLLNKDAVKHSSIDRIIGGEIAPDIEEIVMVRRPPQPQPAAPAPAAPAPAPAPVAAPTPGR
jgi:uncharacterized protein (TIGR02246 family)